VANASQGEDELSRRLDQSKDPAHVFHFAAPQVFHIQALLLIEVIAMFNAAAQTPIGVALLSDGYAQQGSASWVRYVANQLLPQLAELLFSIYTCGISPEIWACQTFKV